MSDYLNRTVDGDNAPVTYYPGWVTLAAVPSVRGTYSLTTQADRNAAFNRFQDLACHGVTLRARPQHPVLVGRRQVRFEGLPTGQLHQDGSSYTAQTINLHSDQRDPDGPNLMSQRTLELDLVTLVQAAAAWAAETGAAGDLMLSAALHRYDGSDKLVRLVVTESAFQRSPALPLPAAPAETTGDLTAIVTDKREAVVVACALVSDLLADMGAHQPHILTPEGNILTDRLNDGLRHELTGWES
ncbi:hypothetical protein ACIBCM_06365 [Streptomyces sp. NPDC051018]|uniref:hypothetical protein n=1 Tax=Streptomyces sp. NPDC051018 TaxID=3365639 RepID=UPI00379B0E5F